MSKSKARMQPSNEASGEQLEITTAEGAAYRQAMQAMREESGAQIKEVGDYLIAVVVEEAEGMYAPADGEGLAWQEPEQANAHLEVAVADRIDGRFVPNLDVEVQVRSADGQAVGQRRLPFLWHPYLYHYGHNWQVPTAGDYAVQVRIEVPQFHRHDPVNGRRYAEPIEVTFDRVHFEPGVKHSPEGQPRATAAGAAKG